MNDTLKATRITGWTLVGVRGEPPLDHGNCFSVMGEDEKEYRIVNFIYENIEALLKRGITMPVKIKKITQGIAVVHDPRIPDEWYSDRFCEVCCPKEFLPLPQRLCHERQIEQGVRIEHKNYVTIKSGKQPKGRVR